MDIKTFYGLVLPSVGAFCLMSPDARHYWYDTQDQLIAGTQQRALNEPNWYFGTVGFGTDDNGKYRRKQEFAIAARSLRLDLDAGEKKLAKHGPEKVYATQAAALAHSVEFIKWSKLVPTLIVSSGEGLHLYYCFDDDFTSMAEWDAHADKLDRMALTFGLKRDPTVTKDAARVLRPVGALHSNGKRIEVLRQFPLVTYAKFADVYAALESGLVAPVTPAASKPRHSINADIMAPVIEVPSSIVKAGAKCGFIAEQLATNGNCGYGAWVPMLNLFKYSTEGEEGAVKWSSGHPEADDEGTRRKLESLTGKPVTCAKISEEHAGCRSCAQWGKIVTPNVLGRLNDREQAAKLAAPAKPAPKAEADDFGSFSDGGEAESEGEPAFVSFEGEGKSEGFASFDDLPDTASATDKLYAAKFEEAVAKAKAEDKTAELIAEGALHPMWVNPALITPHAGSVAAFFLARDAARRIVLCCYRKVEIKDEAGNKTTTYQVLQITRQPFCFREHIDDGQVIGIRLRMYDSADRNKAAWQEVLTTSGEIMDDYEWRKAYGAMSVSYVDNSNEKETHKMLHLYARSNLALLRDQNNGESFGKHLGFQFLHEKPVYVQGGYKVGDDGVVERCFLSGPLRSIKGAYDMPLLASDRVPDFVGDFYADAVLPAAKRYCEGIKHIYGTAAPKEVERYGFAWLLGVASPYLALAMETEPNPAADMPGMGFTVSMYSQGSGFGKSALQANIMRAFGNPDGSKAGGDTKTGASTIAIGVAMAARGGLPYMIDEASNRKPEEVSDLVYKISQGKDKVRANRDGSTVDRTGQWTSISTLSSNVSMRTLLASNREQASAEQMRLMEIEFDTVDLEKLDQTSYQQLTNALLLPNEGALGLVLGRHAVMNWTKLRQRGAELRQEAIAKFELQQAERFFTMAYAAARLTGEVLAQYDILPISLEMFDAMFMTTMQRMRGYVAQQQISPAGNAVEMIRQLLPRMIRTMNETDNRKLEVAKYDAVLNKDVPERKAITGRMVVEDGRAYISVKEMEAWANKASLDHRRLIEAWVAEGILIPAHTGKVAFSKNIAAGINPMELPKIPLQVVHFNLNKLDALFLGNDEETPDNVVEMRRASRSETASASVPAEPTGTQE